MARENKTRYALLGWLSMESASGYDMKIHMQKTTDHFWREGDSSIYPILKQLLKEGLVICTLSNTDSDKPKKMYAITREGRQALKDWLLQAPDLFQRRNELLLKVFFGWNVKRENIIAHLEDYRRVIKTNLDEFKNIIKKIPDIKSMSNDRLHRFLTLRAGIIYSEASLKWCDEAIELLKNEND